MGPLNFPEQHGLIMSKATIYDDEFKLALKMFSTEPFYGLHDTHYKVFPAGNNGF